MAHDKETRVGRNDRNILIIYRILYFPIYISSYITISFICFPFCYLKMLHLVIISPRLELSGHGGHIMSWPFLGAPVLFKAMAWDSTSAYIHILISPDQTAASDALKVSQEFLDSALSMSRVRVEPPRAWKKQPREKRNSWRKEKKEENEQQNLFRLTQRSRRSSL